jgi:hypothetical protein
VLENGVVRMTRREEAIGQETLSEMALRLEEEERDEFAETAQMMIERHRAGFQRCTG